jgi:hypothetical protein
MSLRTIAVGTRVRIHRARIESSGQPVRVKPMKGRPASAVSVTMP